MFKMYILYSESRDRFYIGATGDVLLERIRRHNSNHKGFTGKTRDWQLKYFEDFDSYKLALKREREIKSWKSRQKIELLIGLEHSG